jgi:hypothetical protein
MTDPDYDEARIRREAERVRAVNDYERAHPVSPFPAGSDLQQFLDDLVVCAVLESEVWGEG